MAEAWPTEQAATAAVEAAARQAFELDIAARREVFPPGVKFPEWDDLDPIQKHGIKEQVLPLVWAALGALPDPRFAAWEQGYGVAYAAAQTDTWTGPEHDNPYPSGL